MSVETIEKAISHPKIGVYRKAFIKRRSATTGVFEADWLEVTSDIKKWGTVKINADSERLGTITLDGIRLTLHNDEGKYNPHDDENSLWSGYMNQQRTLVKIQTGFYYDTQGADLIWNRRMFPGNAEWDLGQWDVDAWDSDDQIFVGLVSGEISLSDTNEVTVQVKPISQVFRDFPAAALTGLGPSLTASGFVTLLRDQTDGSSNFIFRPFFGDTTSNWDITASTNVYADLSTTTADDVRDSTVWEIVEKLAEAENYSAYVDQQGVFHFVPRTAGATVAFEFHGLGSFDTEYGHTIKKLSRFGQDFSKYYSRVLIQYRPEDTSTSYVSTSASLSVSGTNTPWALGAKTLELQNFWIADNTAASAIAASLFTEYSQLKDVIEFTTSFVPHLSILDRISVSYDSTTRAAGETIWDSNDWDTELTWDYSTGDAIRLEAEEFKFLSMEINLDTFECKFKAREI